MFINDLYTRLDLHISAFYVSIWRSREMALI